MHYVSVSSSAKYGKEQILMFTQAIQLNFAVLLRLLSERLGDSSPNWRHMPSITHKNESCACSMWRLRLARLNSSQSTHLFFHCIPVCPFSLFFPSLLACWPPAVRPGAFHLLPPILLMTYLDCILPSISPLLPPSLLVMVIFIPLCSGSNYGSGSRPISISRGPQRQDGKVNMEIQSPHWTPSASNWQVL